MIFSVHYEREVIDLLSLFIKIGYNPIRIYDIWVHPVTKAELHSFTIITVPGNFLLHQLPSSKMPVLIPKGREINWLYPSNHLTDILGMLEIFPAERMNAYPINRDYDKVLPLQQNF